MILHGNQRGGGAQLARHLMNVMDNDHVTIHEMRGFVSKDLHGAFKEAQAVSLGTGCRQFLYSLSLSPPPDADAPVSVFEQAVSDIEEQLGLSGQPRAIIFHEKFGRRHAHAVWSRIDVDAMKAINLSFPKLKLRRLSQSLFYANDWTMPMGLMDSAKRDPLNFSHAEYQQAIRNKLDTKSIKRIFQECWAVSDNRDTFAHALAERGFYLANGRRGFVALDWRGEIFAVRQWADIRTKQLKAKLGEPDQLPSVETVTARLSEGFTEQLQAYADDLTARHVEASKVTASKRRALVQQQRSERTQLAKDQERRRVKENKTLASRLPTGLKALWFRLTGQYKKIRASNEEMAEEARKRDETETQEVIQQQLAETQRLEREVRQMRHHHVREIRKLNQEIGSYLALPGSTKNRSIDDALNPRPTRKKRRRPSRSPGM